MKSIVTHWSRNSVLLWHVKVHYHVYKIVMSQFNTVHIFTSYVSRIKGSGQLQTIVTSNRFSSKSKERHNNIHNIRDYCNYIKHYSYAGSEVLTVIVMKGSIFVDVILSNPVKLSWLCRGKFCPIFKVEVYAKFCLLLQHWRGNRYVPSKYQLNFNGIHSVLFQKVGIFNIILLRACIHTSVFKIFYKKRESAPRNASKFFETEFHFIFYISCCTQSTVPLLPPVVLVSPIEKYCFEVWKWRIPRRLKKDLYSQS
jgi:hypothetical protein